MDLEYPRVDISRCWLLPETIEMRVTYLIRGKVPSAEKDVLWEGRIREESNPTSCSRELKAVAKGMNEFVEELKRLKVNFGLDRIEYGAGKDAWEESCLGFFVKKGDPNKLIPLLMDTVLKNCKMPRQYFVRRVPTYEEVLEALKKANKAER